MYPTLTVGWTLNMEVFFYLVLTLALAVHRRRAFALCAAVLCILPLVWRKDWPYASVLSSRKLYEFVLGMGIAHAYTAVPALRARAERSRWLALLLVAIALACSRFERSAAHLGDTRSQFGVVLRRIEGKDVRIWVEWVPDEGTARALRDRLQVGVEVISVHHGR